jgi:parvulin-like peptidyl-prolyl isomerase
LHKALKAVLLIVFILAIAIFSGCGKKDIVATVNGEEITRTQLNEELENMKKYYKSMGMNVDENNDKEFIAQLESTTLDQLITQTILVQEGEKLGIKVSAADIDKQIAQYKESMTEEKYKQTLAANGWTEPKFKGMLEKEMLISKIQEKVLADVKPPTEQAVQEYYEKNKSNFIVPIRYEVRHILIMTDGKEGDPAKVKLEAKTQALAILEQIKKGSDFAELAKIKSEDPGTASKGGVYAFSPGEAVEAFEAAVKTLSPGQVVSEPVETEYGYHIIKLEKITPETQKTFQDAKSEIVSLLTDESNQKKMNGFIEEARKKAQIVNYLVKSDDSNKNETTKK